MPQKNYCKNNFYIVRTKCSMKRTIKSVYLELYFKRNEVMHSEIESGNINFTKKGKITFTNLGNIL